MTYKDVFIKGRKVTLPYKKNGVYIAMYDRKVVCPPCPIIHSTTSNPNYLFEITNSVVHGMSVILCMNIHLLCEIICTSVYCRHFNKLITLVELGILYILWAVEQ